MIDSDEFFTNKKGFNKTILSPEIIKIGILHNTLKSVMSLAKKNGGKNQSFYFLYAFPRMVDIFKISRSYFCANLLIICILPRESCIMKKGCQEYIGLIFAIYSLFVTKISDASIDIERVVDVVVRIMIDRIEEIEYIPKCTVDYFLFIHPYEDNENKILPHSIYQE